MKAQTVVVRVLRKPLTIQHMTSVVLHGETSAIWRAISEPETSVQIDPSVIAASRWGTARGLGEVQCFMHRIDGRSVLSAHAVVKYQHERRAVAEGLTHGILSGSETTLEQISPGSVEVGLRSWQTLPVGTPTRLAKIADRLLREHVDTAARGFARMFASPADMA